MLPIFGNSKPVLFDGTNYIELEHSTVDADYLNNEYMIQTSVLNGYENYISKKSYSKINVTVYLYKYDDPKSKYDDINNLKDTFISFIPTSGSSAVKDLYGNDIVYKITDMIPFYLTKDYGFQEAVTITMQSTSSFYYPGRTSEGYGHNYGYNYGHS